MGGDYGLSVTIPACAKAIKKNASLKLLLVGDEERITKALTKAGVANHARITVIHASQTVEMDELPSHAMRNKRDSSMRVAVNLVKKGMADACISAGNTGALMAISRFILKTLPGIDRPAIMSEMPTIHGTTRIMDLGANVDSCAEHLFQFAVMGSALIRAIDKVENPKIGLLNIGVEEIKGNDQVKRTANMLADCGCLNYVGYCEGDDFFTGDYDLVVCDGFVGNVALKASEGLARYVQFKLKEAFKHSWFSRMGGLVVLPVMKRFKKSMDPSQYNGACLLGLNGIVVKSHGGANVVGFIAAIEQAAIMAHRDVANIVRDKITEFVNEGLIL